ncbi:MAG: precorrin-3B C(17)-methyltransferase [Alphaproteobacteria bacterium]|nr:precorrin-3B C(17)-methyltransferase [Alphaproteobacteria bacterium]
MINLVLLSKSGFILANKLQKHYKDQLVLYGFRSSFFEKLPEYEIDYYYDHLPTVLQELFMRQEPIVVAAASGIVIRSLAPLIQDKLQEAPVLVISPDGSYIIPLLGGHRGGNKLAREIAGVLGGNAVLTNPSDYHLGFGFDDWPAGWKINQPDKIKNIISNLNNGEKIRLIQEVDLYPNHWSSLIINNQSKNTVRISYTSNINSDELNVYPSILALGVGCISQAPSDVMLQHIFKTLDFYKLSRYSIACVVSVEQKMAEKSIQDLSEILSVPSRFFSVEQLLQQTDKLTQKSETVFRELGCWGVAEAAALAAVGLEGKLLVPKQKGDGVTCAIAIAKDIIDPNRIGHARGKLMLVGLGPGNDDNRTVGVHTALAQADYIIGYRGYFNLLPTFARHKNCCVYEIGQEIERVDHAIKLALLGYQVALLGSGDSGIYGMASLTFERLSVYENALALLIDVVVYPGVTAMIAAAAKTGAILGHDFCAISLSDLLTPRYIIEDRVQSAINSDFVIAFYNPVSQKRQSLFLEVQEWLKNKRPYHTPVVVARSVGRADEKITMTTLDKLSTTFVDMNTVVIVGNSSSRFLKNTYGQQWVYTPRGYQDKI